MSWAAEAAAQRASAVPPGAAVAAQLWRQARVWCTGDSTTVEATTLTRAHSLIGADPRHASDVNHSAGGGAGGGARRATARRPKLEPPAAWASCGSLNGLCNRSEATQQVLPAPAQSGSQGGHKQITGRGSTGAVPNQRHALAGSHPGLLPEPCFRPPRGTLCVGESTHACPATRGCTAWQAPPGLHRQSRRAPSWRRI